MTRTVLRGACALRSSGFDFERRPLDVLIEGERITAIEPANTIPLGPRAIWRAAGTSAL